MSSSHSFFACQCDDQAFVRENSESRVSSCNKELLQIKLILVRRKYLTEPSISNGHVVAEHSYVGVGIILSRNGE